MATERTPDEMREDQLAQLAVQRVLDQAIEDLASWKYAEHADLDPQVCERWVNATWNGLRDSLDEEERIRAILILIEPLARERYQQLLRGGVR